MSKRGGPVLYREQAARLKALAAEIDDPALQLQFRDLATSLQMLADFTVVKRDVASSTDAA
jgi:hypothetical protein